jgi:hypothetical protein
VTKHPFDPVALVFGLVFAAAGVIVLTGDRLIDEGRVLAPLGLVALGVGLLLRPARPSPTPPIPAAPFDYADTRLAEWPSDPTEEARTAPDHLAATDATTTDLVASPATHDAPGGDAPPSDVIGQPSHKKPDDSRTGGDTDSADPERDERPEGPGVDFYLGPEWQAPTDEPDDDRPTG